MIAFRTTLALACLSVGSLAGHHGGHIGGHGGGYESLGYGHGSLYGYGLGGMSYGLNYGRNAGGYSKGVIAKPAIIQGGGYPGGYGGGYGGSYGGGYGGGYGGSHGLGYNHIYAGEGIGLGGYGDHGYGRGVSFGGYGGKNLVIPKGHGHIEEGYGGHGHLGDYGVSAYGGGTKGLPIGPIARYGGVAATQAAYAGSGYGKAFGGPLVKEYGGVALGGHGLGYGGGHVGYAKAAGPISFEKGYGGYGHGGYSDLGHGARYAEPFIARANIGHGTPIYSGIVKAGVPVSLARGW